MPPEAARPPQARPEAAPRRPILAALLAALLGLAVVLLRAALNVLEGPTAGQAGGAGQDDQRQAAGAAERLRYAEALIQSIGDTLPDVVLYQLERSPEGAARFRFVSANVERRWGVTPEQLYADSELLWGRIHPEDRPGFERAARQARESLTPFEHEMRFIAPDGSVRWSLGRSSVQLLPDGSVLRNGVAVDITARKEAELALAASEARYRTLFSLLPLGVALMDASGRVLEANPASERLIGPATAGRAWELTDAAGRPLALEATPALVASREGRTVTDFEMGVRRPDGGQAWLSVSAAPIPSAPGHAVATYCDITERHRAAEELGRARDAAETAARAKSDFLATLSHEIRTPLNAVVGMAAVLLDTDLTPQQRACAETIATGGKALRAVIGDILEFARIEAGRAELEAAPFDLPGCLSSTLGLVAHEAQRKGLAVSIGLDPGLPPLVTGDESRLRQVVLNLLANAIKFTEAGAVALHVTAAPLDGGVLLTVTVRDTGIGMTAAQLQRVFEPFVQGDSSTARRYGGAGLGLAISARLAALMGGTLTATSAPGAGSAFTLTVPLAVAPGGPSPGAAPQRPLRVLVAEDNPVNQEVTRWMLARLGHTVTVVGDGVAAVRAAAVDPYDVLLLDVQMPGLDGVAAAWQIRAGLPAGEQPRIIALTAGAGVGERERLLGAGMDGYLLKPVQIDDLVAALGTVAPPAAPRPPAGEEPLLDGSMLARFVAPQGAVLPEKVRLALWLFEEILGAQVDAIERAAGSPELARREAHRLRGGAMQLGARALGALGLRLEGAGPDADLPALAAELRACHRASVAEFRRRYPPPD